MAIRNLRYEGDEILRKRSREIEEIDDKIKELAKDMMETMHKYEGVGLAGPQVGILKRIIVIDLYEEGTQFTLINPVIVKTKGEQLVDEGCLSFPQKFGKVKRPKEVEVVALDLDGKKVRIKAKDLLAQALSHEIDHLDGKLFVDKVEPGTLEIVTPENKEEKKAERKANRKK
jgi:peptide deformylase